jgi:hypothetical protein
MTTVLPAKRFSMLSPIPRRYAVSLPSGPAPDGEIQQAAPARFADYTHGDEVRERPVDRVPEDDASRM